MNKISGIENVILDLDGTVLLHSPNQTNEMFRILELDPNIEFVNQIESFWMNLDTMVGNGKRVTWDQIYLIIQKNIPYLNKINLSPKRWLKIILEADEITLSKGVYEMLDYLKGEGYNVFACTNWFSHEHTRTLEQFDILAFFEKVYGWDITCAKPNKKALGGLITKKTKNEFVIIGDSIHTDIEFASNVGIKSIWYNVEGKRINSDIKPTIEIKDFIEVKKYL